MRQTNQGAGHLCGREPVRAGVSAGHRHGQMKKAAALEESRVAAFLCLLNNGFRDKITLYVFS